MSDELSEETKAQKPRRARPEIQIYRPPGSKGLLNKTNSQTSLSGNSETSFSPNKQRNDKNDVERSNSYKSSGNTTPENNHSNDRTTFNKRPKEYQKNPQKSYDSTQSLIDSRGGYLDHGRTTKPPHRQPFERPSSNRRFDQRSSMRSEGAITSRRNLGGGRRRNDSFTSTRSELPQPSTSELNLDVDLETQSQCAPSYLSTQSIDQMFDSINSMDWSKIMEEEDQLRLNNEKEEKERQEAENLKKEEEKQKVSEATRDLPRGLLRLNMHSQQQPRTFNDRRDGDRFQKNNRRQRKDSDRSSTFGGSIAEERFEDDENVEERSGERTPTSVRARSPKYWVNDRYDIGYQNNKTPDRRQGKQFVGQKEERRRYRGEHDDRYDEEVQYKEEPKTGRLAGRLSFVQPTSSQNRRGSNNRNDEPRTLNRDISEPEKKVVVQKRSSPELKSVGLTHEEKRNIQKTFAKMEPLFVEVAKRKNVESANLLVEMSGELSKVFCRILTEDIVYTFTNNVELQLFKQAFHKPIEHLKSGANSSASSAKGIRLALQVLLANGISFYEEQVINYENHFNIPLNKILIWPEGGPPETFGDWILAPVEMSKISEKEKKYAIKSLARLQICMGDLHRYKAMVDGSEDYSFAKMCYQRASQLWPSSGHPYNQLGVLAFFSERVQDEIFNLIRALSTEHVYLAARDRLTNRLAAMREKVAKYEPLLDTECGKVNDQEETPIERNVEIWLKGDKREEQPTVDKMEDVFLRFQRNQPSKNHRRTTSYLVDMFGQLLTRIGMEHFGSVSERALAMLAASIEQPTTPFTSLQLTKFVVFFLYAVERTAATDSLEDNTVVSLQQQIAVRAVFSLFVTLARAINPTLTTDEMIANEQVQLILPPLNIISEWILSETGTRVYSNMPTVEPLTSSILPLDLDKTLEAIDAINLPEETSGKTFFFPEHVFLSAFSSLFAKLKSFTGENMVVERLRRLKDAVQHVRSVRPQLISTVTTRPVADEQKDVEDHALTRATILDLERRKNAVMMVVRPEMVLPDTNAMIDHLDIIKRVVESKRFDLLISTIVINELEGLAQANNIGNSHEVYLRSSASEALKWLKVEAKARNAHMATLTTTGNRIQLYVAGEEVYRKYGEPMINDDLIIQSCANLATSIPEFTPPMELNDVETVTRTIVILSEDRGLTIKAINQKIPCRTVHAFVHWAFDGV